MSKRAGSAAPTLLTEEEINRRVSKREEYLTGKQEDESGNPDDVGLPEVGDNDVIGLK